jgi:hypothetical protein
MPFRVKRHKVPLRIAWSRTRNDSTNFLTITGGDGMGWVGLGWKRHGSGAKVGACVRMRMDAAGGTLSASSVSGQRVRAYARRYIDEPNVSCTRTHVYRRANAEWRTGAHERAPARTRALARSVKPSFLRAHKLLNARARRARNGRRVHYACGRAANIWHLSRCIALVGSAVRWSRTSAAWVATRSSDIWSRIPLPHCGSESITSTKLPRSWN